MSVEYKGMGAERKLLEYHMIKDAMATNDVRIVVRKIRPNKIARPYCSSSRSHSDSSSRPDGMATFDEQPIQ